MRCWLSGETDRQTHTEARGLADKPESTVSGAPCTGPPPSTRPSRSPRWPPGRAVALKGPRLGRRRQAGGGCSPPASLQNNSHPPPPPPPPRPQPRLCPRRAERAAPGLPPSPRRFPSANERVSALPCPPLPSLSRKNKEAGGAPFPPGFAPLREPPVSQYLPRWEGAGARPLLRGLPRAGAARRAGCRRIRGAARRASLSRPSCRRCCRAPLRSAPAGLWLWALAAAAAASLHRALQPARPRRRLALPPGARPPAPIEPRARPLMSSPARRRPGGFKGPAPSAPGDAGGPQQGNTAPQPCGGGGASRNEVLGGGPGSTPRH